MIGRKMDNTTKGFAHKIISELEKISHILRDYLQHPHSRSPGNQRPADNEAGNANQKIDSTQRPAPEAGHPCVTHEETTCEKYTKGLKKANPWIEAIGLIVLIRSHRLHWLPSCRYS